MWAIVLVHIQYVKTEERVPCAMVKDWFPSGVEPQTSKPPYALEVIPPDGKSPYQGELHYGPGEELTYTSKIFWITLPIQNARCKVDRPRGRVHI